MRPLFERQGDGRHQAKAPCEIHLENSTDAVLRAAYEEEIVVSLFQQDVAYGH